MYKLAEAFVFAVTFYGCRDHDETQEGWDWYCDRDVNAIESLSVHLMALTLPEQLVIAEAAKRLSARKIVTGPAESLFTDELAHFMENILLGEWTGNDVLVVEGARYTCVESPPGTAHDEVERGFSRKLAEKLLPDALMQIAWRHDEAPGWCIEQDHKAVGRLAALLDEASTGERELLAGVFAHQLGEHEAAMARQRREGGLVYYQDSRSVEVLTYLRQALFGEAAPPC